ncbi:ras GTPase-activating-like protein IQGAP1 [Lycorma delicatula]|uniref:ras GTPase-activating-like protein IQGAP1 n=1 Tax=Lycorma delicatula TaxID=130591 RepID=UPI003F5100C4
MDEKRHQNVAYEYLCHLEEAKNWLEGMLKETVPPCTELEENLRNGIVLARLGNLLAPEVVPKFRIYDLDSKRYNAVGLQFRHTDNITYWIKSLNAVNLPKIFHPETTDVYDKKNMPKVILCIHALGTHLFKLGRGPLLQDLYGKMSFSDDVIKDKSIELQECGVVMPAFQGIGRLLGYESGVDCVMLHHLINSINSTLDSQDCDALMKKLTDDIMCVPFVLLEYAQNYFETLTNAKATKLETAQNRSLNDSSDQDEYDGLLTQAEIQGHITFVNGKCYLTWVKHIEELKTQCSKLFDMLRVLSNINWGAVWSCMIHFYYFLFRPHLDYDCVAYSAVHHTVLKMQDAVHHACLQFTTGAFRSSTIISLIVDCDNPSLRDRWDQLLASYFAHLKGQPNHLALDSVLGNHKLGRYEDHPRFQCKWNEILSAMQKHDSAGVFNDLNEENKGFYAAELQDFIESSSFMTISSATGQKEILQNIVKVGNQEASVERKKLIKNNPDGFAKALLSLEPLLPSETFIQFAIPLYYEEMKVDTIESGEKLGYSDVVASLRVLSDIAAVSVAIDVGCPDEVWEALSNSNIHISSLLEPELKLQYWRALTACRQFKIVEQCFCTLLCYMDIHDCIALVNAEHRESGSAIASLQMLNNAVKNDDIKAMEKALQNPALKISEKLSFRDLSLLLYLLKKQYQEQAEGTELWLIDIQEAVQRVCKEVQEVIQEKNDMEETLSCIISHADLNFSNGDSLPCFISLQKYKCLKEKNSDCNWTLHFTSTGLKVYLLLHDENPVKFTWDKPDVVKSESCDSSRHLTIYEIQRWWRKVHKNCQNQLDAKATDVSFRKCSLVNISLEYKITKIQALWRGYQARKNYFNIILCSNPSYKAVQRCIHMIEFNTEDYDRELQLQALKAEVTQTIRYNNELAKKLDEMDVTIGLLIENRITLQNVIAAGKKLNEAVSGTTGLKALSASSRRQLYAYQHLLYTLQTSPHYLAKLLFCLPQNRFSKFLKIVILTLFNFRTTSREEYLLLKLFQHALHEEIRCKIMKPSDVVTGDPLVLNLAVNYARQHSGQNTLRHILGPMVTKVLNNKQLSIDTNPVNIYNKWRNEMEMDSGKPSNLPYPVTQEQALNYEEVCKRLNNNIGLLKSNALTFINHIMKSKAAIPYGLLFIARELSFGLRNKFPDIPEKEVLKVIGNLIYYRFINAAIVAPDAFDIIGPEQALLSNTQRHNLASIAKILQFAASKKGFGDESPHLQCLNSFLIDCHEVFKQFLRSCCDVEDLERHFSVTEFTEVTLINQPTIHITLMELREMHKLLVEFADQIAPDPHDSLHELLADLGPVPTAAQLMGYVCDDVSDAERHLAQTQICLTLTNKFEVIEDDKTDLTKLFIKTKELLVEVLPFLSGHNLPGGLRIEPTQEQIEGFLQKPCKKNRESDKILSGLRECKAKLRKLLSQLEDKGLVSRDDGYQTIISSIGNDILNKGRYREIQQQELQTVRNAKKTLDEKTKFYEDKVKFYNEYINKCLENISQSKRNVHTIRRGEKNRKMKSKPTLKYSASQLKEKGVVVSIEGLPNSQFKNVLFEITPSDSVGIFDIKGKFMGVEVETVEINIQKLLQLQYEGIHVMDIFGKAKININILLYLLNKKFYC